jgi:tetratricopeptide (TPR) repeat protein
LAGLLKEVWPDSFVEESNLSQNIFLLRKALGDTAENRQYIVTLPGRGYQFAASVHTVMQQGEVLVAHARTRTQIVIEENEPETDQALKTLPIPLRPGVSRKFLLSMAGVTVFAATSTFLFLRPGKKVLTEKDTVVLADFDNSTGDPVFDGTLRQGMGVQLEQSPFLSLIPDQRIQQTLKLMGQPVDARLTPTVAREVCERTASAAVLDGSIASLGSQYVLGLRATDCRTGKVLAEEQVQAARKEDVLNALGQVASRFRTRVGESLATVEKYDTPLAQATTSSLEALKAYSLGQERRAAGAVTAALPFFKRAVGLDPNFAMAYSAMGGIYSSHQEPERAAENIRKAYELRDKVSERERIAIEAAYFRFGTGELEKAAAAYELWQQTYPCQHESPGDRADSRAWKIRERCGGWGCLLDPLFRRKGMHHRTFRRLAQAYEQACSASAFAFSAKMGMSIDEVLRLTE